MNRLPPFLFGLLLWFCSVNSSAQDDFILTGFAATQNITQESHIPAMVVIQVSNEDGIIDSLTTSTSGSFFLKLPIDQSYSVSFSKPGFIPKRVLLDFKNLPTPPPKKNKLRFEFELVLLQERFLTENFKDLERVNRIFWSDNSSSFVYTSDRVANYWDEFADLKEAYASALKDRNAERMTRMMLQIERDIIWPEDPGDSLKILVLDDYPTFVQLKLMQDTNERMAQSEVALVEGINNLGKAFDGNYDILFATNESGVSHSELLDSLKDGSLLFTEGFAFHKTMVNFKEGLYTTKFEVNDVELTKRGFQSMAEVREIPGHVVDRALWDDVIFEAQETLLTQRQTAIDLSEEKDSLQVENTVLEGTISDLDSALLAKELLVTELNAEIDQIQRTLDRKTSELRSTEGALDRALALREKNDEAVKESQRRIAKSDSILVQSEVKLANTQRYLAVMNNQLYEATELVNNQRNVVIGLGAIGLLILFLLILTIRSLSKEKRLALENKTQATRIERQRQLLNVKNTELNDSIKYAKRIQDSILPAKDLLAGAALAESFIYYQPKDIVAGDFYWIREAEDGKHWFAVADCTGHGVPGAMVSLVCHNALNRALRDEGVQNPAQLLDHCRNFVLEQLASQGAEIRDGMDIAVCLWDPKNKVLEYAGAQNPLWVFSQREMDIDGPLVRKQAVGDLTLVEVKGDKQPVGAYEHASPYTNHRIQLQSGDTVYLFSDGFVDQFGGKRGKKLKQKLFKELLALSTDQSLDGQEQFLHEYFENWRGDLEQVDDVCVMGVKVA